MYIDASAAHNKNAVWVLTEAEPMGEERYKGVYKSASAAEKLGVRKEFPNARKDTMDVGVSFLCKRGDQTLLRFVRPFVPEG